MLNPGLFIHAASAVAPEADTRQPVLSLAAREPDYSGIIPPMQLRRMSKLVRMSVGAAKDCLRQAGLARPDAIIMGTALGCLADTELFLKKMLEQKEQMLTPTAFIQSTHNTPAGQIALSIGCQGYNNTLSQQGHSFESAVMAAALFIAENPEASVLCGAGDELTATSLGLMQRLGLYTKRPRVPGIAGADEGAIAGEGVGFFVLRKSPEGALARISGLAALHELMPERAARRFQDMLNAAGGLRDTDLVLCGAMPHTRSSIAYPDALHGGFAFRQQSGAWPTDLAAAMATLLRKWPAEKQRTWLVNHWGNDYSLWLLER
jgi:3-oxoacyl-(acyl-carrier-protein) synthase